MVGKKNMSIGGGALKLGAWDAECSAELNAERVQVIGPIYLDGKRRPFKRVTAFAWDELESVDAQLVPATALDRVMRVRDWMPTDMVGSETGRQGHLELALSPRAEPGSIYSALIPLSRGWRPDQAWVDEMLLAARAAIADPGARQVFA